MSPEQAEGKPVDARSDIFSFGSVLYEMVTGRRAFAGDSTVGTLSAILHKEPSPNERIPLDLEKIIGRCLRKDPNRRIQHMGDVALALEELFDTALPATGPAAAAKSSAFVGCGRGAVHGARCGTGSVEGPRAASSLDGRASVRADSIHRGAAV
jgi:hypothetical protein